MADARSPRRLAGIADPEALLIGLFEHSPVSFQIYDAGGHSIFVNDAFRAMFLSEPPPEYSVFQDEIVAKQGLVDLVRRAFAGETVHIPPVWYDPRELEHVKVQVGRRVGIEGTLFPLRDANGTIGHIAVCAKDVTAQLELKDALEALRRSEEQLRQSQKLEAVGRLAGGVAHDFNNLLSVVLSYSELLLRRLGDSSPAAPDIREIRRAGERAADLTRQLLAFSRQQVLAPRVFDVNEVVDGMSRMLGRVLGEHVQLETRLGRNLGRVRADPNQVEQVIMNLAVNGRDAMESGGVLTIETADVELDAAYCREHAGTAPGPHVMIAVTDTGSGMDRATQARVFEPFFTTKPQGKGTGLGLSTVFGIVRQSGGSIWLYSEPGRGTTFKVYFPRVDERTSPSVRPSAGSPAVTQDESGTGTILLVEDEDQVRRVARGILEGAGYRVLEASGPAMAIDMCESHAGEIHLLLTDVVMPGMGGPALASRITQRRPSTRVAFMSGYAEGAVFEQEMPRPGVTFLQKPLTPLGLVRKVREALTAP